MRGPLCCLLANSSRFATRYWGQINCVAKRCHGLCHPHPLPACACAPKTGATATVTAPSGCKGYLKSRLEPISRVRRNAMSHNTFGHLFRVTTWGESHGPAIGCVVDGCPPGLPLEAPDLQKFLDKRRPGQSRFTTQRQEPDTVEILSGVFEDKAGRQVTTGAPISLLIRNVDQRTRDYSDIKDKFRPGHADFTYWAKYGIRDYRGGGRSSARETAMRGAAGGVARKVIPGVTIRGALVQIGRHKLDRSRWAWGEVDNNPFFSPDPGI